MTVVIEALTVVADDGHRFDLRMVDPGVDGPSLLFLPAMGVRASFYDGFADRLAAVGLRVGVPDLRGLGTSSLRSSRSVDFGFHTILSHDIPAAIDAFGGGPLFLGGHSLGGQLSLLAASKRRDVVGVAVVGTCLPHYRTWDGLMGAGIRVLGVAAPLIARAVGHFPGARLGFGGREARGVMADWGRVVRKGEYRLSESDDDWESQLATMTQPVLAIDVEGDTWAPAAAVDALVAKCRLADVVRQQIRCEEARAHFSWIREPRECVEAFARFTAV